jgi:hypothetical protein
METIALLLCCLTGAAAEASEQGARKLSEAVDAIELAKSQGAPAPISDQDLAGISGGAALQIQALTRQNLTAAVSGNSLNAETIESGTINFSANALSGFNGIGNFVINTGNNNVLQGSLSVTIVTAPSP